MAHGVHSSEIIWTDLFVTSSKLVFRIGLIECVRYFFRFASDHSLYTDDVVIRRLRNSDSE